MLSEVLSSLALLRATSSASVPCVELYIFYNVLYNNLQGLKTLNYDCSKGLFNSFVPSRTNLPFSIIAICSPSGLTAYMPPISS